jgi:hypothetical protein
MQTQFGVDSLVLRGLMERNGVDESLFPRVGCFGLGLQQSGPFWKRAGRTKTFLKKRANSMGLFTMESKE